MEQRLTLKGIEELDDIGTAFEICESHGIPTEGLANIKDIIERLKMHYLAAKHGNYRRMISESMARDGIQDEKKRQQLIEMFQKLLHIVQPSDESQRHRFVRDFLSSDGTTSNILEDCNKRILELGKNEAVLLIAGETNAGKSSFLNLLFGMDVLPVSALSCTSLITTVRYGPRRRFKVIYKDPSKPMFETESLEEFHKIAFPRGKAREIDHGVKEAQAFLPLDILKGGLVLTDSPGVGENDFLEDYLMEYIAENDILGFIYIIFSDNAGGVQEDRLLQLLKLVIQEQKKKKALPFDPKAALFVGNRFDAVEESAKETVKQHITSKLKSCYAQFDDSKIVFFSTMNAKRDISAHPDYINANFRSLLDNLSRLYNYVTERRLSVYYKWIEYVLQRVSHVMKSATTRLALTQRENTERSQRHKHSLEKLQNDTDVVIKDLRAEVSIQTKKISQEVQKHLSQPMTKMRLTSSWKDGEIPQVTSEVRNASHWLWIKQRVDDAFYDRVYTELEDWSFENNTIAKIEEEIVLDIETKLGVLQAEISSSENALKNSRESTGSTDSESRRMSLKRVSLKPNLIEIPEKMPAKLSHRIKPFFAFGRRKETIKFEKDPVQWAGRRSEKLLTQLLKNKKQRGKGPLDTLLEVLMQRPSEIIDLLEEKIPTIINANMELLDKLEEIALSQKRDASVYEKMLEDIEELKTGLMYYGEGYVFVNDFKLSEIRIFTGQQGDGRSLHRTFRVSSIINEKASNREKKPFTKEDPHGLWTFSHAGVLQRDGTEKPITIKLYTTASGMSCNKLEVAKLRSLLSKDTNLAEFLGIHHTDTAIPAYIFDQRLMSLSTFMRHCEKPDNFLPKVLYETASGLFNLHTKGLVHMELSQHTITVTEQGEVRLTGACVPRKASVPLDCEAKVGNFVYLPYEVLKEELYITSGDVYGFGLLLYELLYNRPAFEAHRSYKYGDFVQDLNPEVMLGLDQESGDLSEAVVRLVQICVKKLNSERSTISTVLSQLQVIGGDLSKASHHSHKESNWGSPRVRFRKNMH